MADEAPPLQNICIRQAPAAARYVVHLNSLHTTVRALTNHFPL